MASHLLLTQDGILNDDIPRERKQGIDAGHALFVRADLVAVYVDRGITEGMQLAIDRAYALGLEVVYRTLGPYYSNAAGETYLTELDSRS